MREIPLVNGRGVALVDDCDFEWLSQFKWYLHPRGYANANAVGRRGVILMHRMIANTPPGMETDHINGDKLDNRRANLRVCSKSQNGANRRAFPNKASRFKGVWLLQEKYWCARITADGDERFIGSFATEEAAARAYDDAARKHFGEFARLNFPHEGEQAA